MNKKILSLLVSLFFVIGFLICVGVYMNNKVQFTPINYNDVEKIRFKGFSPNHNIENIATEKESKEIINWINSIKKYNYRSSTTTHPAAQNLFRIGIVMKNKGLVTMSMIDDGYMIIIFSNDNSKYLAKSLELDKLTKKLNLTLN